MLTNTRTFFRSGLTVAPVMVTKPTRGSRTSRSRRREISPLIRSDTRSVRVLTESSSGGSGEELDLAAQDLAGHPPLDFVLDRRERLLQRHPGRRDPDDSERGPLPEVLEQTFSSIQNEVERR